jgi:RNA recognition motif-containing protein
LYVPPPVSNRICVENLDARTKWITLQNHFKPAGTVTKVDISTAEGGKRPKHFVEFATAQEAARAAKRLNKSVVDGHKIAVYMVEPAKPDVR